MKLDIRRALVTAAAGSMLIWCAGGTAAQPALETGADAQVTPDGLHRVDTSVMEAAWVTPDLDLSHYTSVFFVPTVVLFREVQERRQSALARDTAIEFSVDDEMKTRFRELFGVTFREDLAEVRFAEPSDTVGRDVLIVQGFLVDVVSRVPPPGVGATNTFIESPWEANIVLEVRDAMSNDLLARTADRQRMGGPISADEVWINTVQGLGRWSVLLCRRLGELMRLNEG